MNKEQMRKWRKYLTPELREEFESLGVEQVRINRNTGFYLSGPKNQAASVWLSEKERCLVRKNSIVFWVMLFTLLFAFLSAVGTFWPQICAIFGIQSDWSRCAATVQTAPEPTQSIEVK